MIKIIYFVLGLMIVVCCADADKPRQRILLYDDDGNIIKTHSNPYLQNLRLNAGLPVYGNFLSPIFGFIKDYGSIFAFTVPVSNAVIQQIKKDPQYHHQLMIVPTNDPVIEPNPLCEGRRAQIPSPNYCNNYLNCWDGWAVEQECPSGLLFSKQGYCDYSDNVNCESRKLRQQPPTQPQCNKDFETFRNQLDCNEFFVCVNRQPVKFKCPTGLVYNQALGVCDYARYVDCSSCATNPGMFAPQSSTEKPSFIPASPPISAPALPPLEPPSVPAVPPVPISPPAQIIPSVPDIPSAPPIPSSPSIPSLPINPPASSQTPSSPAIPIHPMPLLPAVMKPEDIKTIYSENSIVNTQSWRSTHIASSLQDAINQLQLKNFANIKV